MKLAKDILILALLLCLIELAGVVNRMLKHVDQLTVEANTRMVGTSQNVNALLIQLGLTADNVRRASMSEQQVSKKTLALLDHTDGLISSTQANVTQITQHANTTLDGLGTLEAALTNTLNTGVVPTLEQLRQAIASVDKNLLQDPDIKTVLAELAKTSEHVDVSSEHVEHMIAYLDKKLTGPTTVKGRVLGALTVIYKIAVIDAVLQHY